MRLFTTMTSTLVCLSSLRAFRAGVALMFATLVCAPSHATLVADSVADYGFFQGQNGWYYGYTDRTRDTTPGYQTADFVQMVLPPGGSNQWVVSPGFVCCYTLLAPTWSHPNGPVGVGGRIGNEQWPLRRWVSDGSGMHEIRGVFQDASPQSDPQDDGVEGLVFLDGALVYSTLVSNTGVPVNFSIFVDLAPGSIVDFAVAPRSYPTFDSTLTTFQVFAVAVPEPSPAITLAAGLALLTALRLRCRAHQVRS